MAKVRMWIGLAVAGLWAVALAAAPPGRWVRSWEAPPVDVGAVAAAPGQPAPTLADVTFRMVARISAGGSALRLRLSNELGDRPLAIGAVHVALAGPDGAPIPGSDRTVTFAGIGAPTIPPLAPLESDPVALAVPALARLVVSIHVPGDAAHVTVHPFGMETAWIAPGDQTGAAAIAGGTTTTRRYILSGIDVSGGPATATIIAFGDSITDGAYSTNDADHRWPDHLADRLKAAGITRFAIANAAISGNCLLDTWLGPSALARLDRDVLAVPGARYLIVLEGINDIGWAARGHRPPPTPEQLIAAYRQIIARAHDHGLKVIGGTLLPYKGASYRVEEGDRVRDAVNRWIRAPGHFDAVIDFDRVVAARADPLAMAPAFDSGDHLHPGDAGYRAMAAAIDLRLFR